MLPTAGPILSQDTLRTQTTLRFLAPQPDETTCQLAAALPPPPAPLHSTTFPDPQSPPPPILQLQREGLSHGAPVFGSLGKWGNRSKENPHFD